MTQLANVYSDSFESGMALSNRDNCENLRRIRNCAIQSLWYELITFPKPGLVSLIDSGSHDDMNAKTFHSSILSLRHYFHRIAYLGTNESNFEALRFEGIAAENRMMRATGGINTHRGAIFILGILAAAAAYALANDVNRGNLGQLAVSLWGDALLNHDRKSNSHGSKVGNLHNVTGALGEVCSGFASVYSFGLPAYRDTLKATSSFHLARVQTFFSLMSNIDDTNLLYRGGTSGLEFAQSVAREFLSFGGVYSDSWESRAKKYHLDFIKRKLSPGGSADLLGACIFIHLIENI